MEEVRIREKEEVTETKEKVNLEREGEYTATRIESKGLKRTEEEMIMKQGRKKKHQEISKRMQLRKRRYERKDYKEAEKVRETGGIYRGSRFQSFPSRFPDPGSKRS